ncbi:amidase [Novosphingobium sp. H3SJ31-1]|uniref:Amidase n=1 Tax=Novosphingobium album (ex Liu et al. 2023) TaxID=3031130 RepID=A0ABT5WNA6_9SPHN|nr:amidase [Novosphingobium album (ex Liu et al. 2023)]
MPTLAVLAADLARGAITSRALVEACLAAIADPEGEGARAFLAVDAEGARAAADRIDGLRRAGEAVPPHAGIPLSIKDLFDVAGQVTRAGSIVLADRPPAAHDAPAVARLRTAGFIPIGRTNMTEFAFSGLGLNPHYGTPRNAWHRDEARIAGGSSSGAAISVAQGMAHAGLGTDTGGSCRIPAAFNRLAGFKPTAGRVPREGAVPLSVTLDSVGPIARSVACCAALDACLAGEAPGVPLDADLAALRLLVPTGFLVEDMEPAIAEGFSGALARLRDAGAAIVPAPLPMLDRIAAINAGGGFPAAEAYAWHRDLIESRAASYDPRVLMRICRGAEQSDHDIAALHAARAGLVREATAALAGFDAVLFPTVPIAPPRIADLADDAAYSRINLLVLRNSTAINMIDGCAISIPIGDPAGPPVGLTIAGAGHADRRVLDCAAAIEARLNVAA